MFTEVPTFWPTISTFGMAETCAVDGLFWSDDLLIPERHFQEIRNILYHLYQILSYGFIWRFPKMRLPPYQVSKTHGDFGIHHRLTHREVQAALRRPDSHRRRGHSIWGHFGIPWYTKLIKVCMVLIDISIIQYLHLDTYMVHHGIYNIFQMIYHDIKPYKCRY